MSGGEKGIRNRASAHIFLSKGSHLAAALWKKLGGEPALE